MAAMAAGYTLGTLSSWPRLSATRSFESFATSDLR